MGAILRQRPGGAWEVVPEFKNAPSAWAKTSAVATFSAVDDLFVVEERTIQGRHYGSVTVSDSDPALDEATESEPQDSLEYLPGPGDDRQGEARGRLSPWRAGVKIKTIHADVLVGETTQAVEVVTDYVLFQKGAGSVSKPVQAITGVSWIGKSLSGGLSHDPDGTEIRSTKPDVALAMITYSSRYLRAAVVASVPADVERLLILEE